MPIATPISTNTLISVAPQCISSKVDDELVVLNTRSGLFCGFNPIGSEIMARLKAPIRFGDLIIALCLAYDGPEDVITAETRRLIEQMAEQGLVDLHD